MIKNSIIILAGLFVFLTIGCSSDEESSEKMGKKFAESLMEKVIEHAAKENGKDVDVNIDLDNLDKDGGVMSIKDENGKEVNVSAKDGDLKITGEDGEEVVFSNNEKEIPKSIPSDVYIVEGSVESAGTVKSKDGELLTFSIKSKNKFDDVIAKISKEMKSSGWKSSMNMNMGGESMQMFTKGDNSATISSKKKDEYVEVAYMVTVKNK